MPSHQTLPTIQDFLQAYGSEVNGIRRPNADTRRGAGHDIFGGTSAVLFSREVTRDRDLFRAIYFDSCTGDDVDVLLEDRYESTRIPASAGVGQAVFERDVATSAGQILTGTRIAVIVPGAEIRFVEVAQDTPYGASDLACVVPVRTNTPGVSRPLEVDTSTGFLRLEDPVDDDSWEPTFLSVGSGTEREKDADYKARTKTDRLSKRVGYSKSITDACAAVGAGQVALYASDQLDDGPDFGINRCFVGFSSFVSTPELVRACRIAVDDVRVLGADLVVMGMDTFAVPVSVTVHLWLPPNDRNQKALAGAAAAAVVEYFNTKQNAWSFRLSAMRGAVLRAMRTDVQRVDFVVGDPFAPIDEPVLSEITYQSSISRIYTTPSMVTVTVLGPI